MLRPWGLCPGGEVASSRSPAARIYDRSQDLKALARKSKRVRPAEVGRFLRDLRTQDQRGTYFYSVNRYIVSAKRRP